MDSDRPPADGGTYSEGSQASSPESAEMLEIEEEEEGVDWGVNQHNRSRLRVDPFSRGSSTHILTLGASRSGKTYGAAKAAGRWYQGGDDRTLIVCDTQSKFDGLTKYFGGEHIVVGWSQTANPLANLQDAVGGEIEASLMDPDVDMAYLDLRQSVGLNGDQQSELLHLMLTQVSQKIKRVPGKSIFIIDEAHLLHHDDEVVDWLQQAAREWAQYDAAMWFISSYLHRLVAPSDSMTEVDEHRETIPELCSTIHVYSTPKTLVETLLEIGMNPSHADDVRNTLTPGEMQRGYSECLMAFDDREQWWSVEVCASPFEHLVLTYTPCEHGDFDEYIRRNWKEI